MVTDQDQKYREMAIRTKYRTLYTYLCELQTQEWRASFREIESIIGFDLPRSARRHRAWWANEGHSHALAWSAAGWETAEVDMGSETLLLRRRKRSDVVPNPSRGTAYGDRRPPSRAASTTRPTSGGHVGATQRCVGGLLFSHVGPVRPNRNQCGEVIGELPQSRFRNERNLPLNKYGEGPFCRFRVALGWGRSGVYVLMNGDTPLYVGECQDLEVRWGPTGYGSISPRNCYKGGQETNCRINNLIYRGTKTGAGFNLWFYPVEGDKHSRTAIERELVSVLSPPWNR